jgi:patatin-like phospholipase/acyl hydrolase
MGIPAEQILGFYRDKGAAIFPTTSGVSGWYRNIRSLFRSRYSAASLKEAIRDVVGNKALREARTRLAIPAYEIKRGTIHVFTTPHHPDRRQDRDELALDVALATSAAPTYFLPHDIPGRGTFIDGGVWGNCPAVIGIVEAVRFCNCSLDEIHVLSISATSYPFRLGERQQLGGALSWSVKIIDTMMFSQVRAAIAEADGLLPARFHRIDHVCPQGTYKIDNVNQVRRLIEAGRGTADMLENRELVNRKFLTGQKIKHFLEPKSHQNP